MHVSVYVCVCWRACVRVWVRLYVRVFLCACAGAFVCVGALWVSV